MVTHSADPFRAFADPTRRAVLGYLLSRPHSVNELADHFNVTRPAISKHLRVLKEARTVSERREGRNRIYQLNPAGLQAVRDYFDRFWDDALQAFGRAAEARQAETTTRWRGAGNGDRDRQRNDRPKSRDGEGER
jgi:DNA-binding transcriptional ArsR family regulator